MYVWDWLSSKTVSWKSNQILLIADDAIHENKGKGNALGLSVIANLNVYAYNKQPTHVFYVKQK